MTNEQQAVVEWFPARFNGQETHLLCPICGFDYVRLVEVEAGPAGKAMQKAKISAKGVSTFPGGAAGGFGRGNTVTLTFQCENGHEFRRSFLFHKGQTILARCGWKTFDLNDVKQALWRD